MKVMINVLRKLVRDRSPAYEGVLTTSSQKDIDPLMLNPRW